MDPILPGRIDFGTMTCSIHFVVIQCAQAVESFWSRFFIPVSANFILSFKNGLCAPMNSYEPVLKLQQ